MALLRFADAISPDLITGGPFDGIAFYIGGDAYRVWTHAEIAAITATYRLPVWVRSNPDVSLVPGDIAGCTAALAAIGAPAGTLVALDSETSVDPAYVIPFVTGINLAGWKVIDYGSESDVHSNDNPDGYYWGADWTSVPHLHSGDGMTQYLSLQDEDESEAQASLPFWKTGDPPVPPVPVPVTTWEDLMALLPVISQGASGPAVCTVQGLCGARGHPAAVDGQFGPLTAAAVQAVQHDAGIAADGIVGPHTWLALAGV